MDRLTASRAKAIGESIRPLDSATGNALLAQRYPYYLITLK